MRRRNEFLTLLGCLVAILVSIILTGCDTNDGPTSTSSWSITQKDSIIEIAYGSEADFHQYAALHLESSYFRMNYGPSSGWGTSVILLPSFWQGGTLYQGAPITATWETVGEDLVLSIAGTISSLSVQVQLRLFPPDQNSISAEVSVNVDGDVKIDERPGEAFKLVMLSSMHIAADVWDTQSAYVDSQTFPIPESEWIIESPITGSRFGLRGGTSAWKINAPTIEIVLDESRSITGWVTPSSDPNDDNVGFWAASDQIARLWQYTMSSSKFFIEE